MAAVYFCAPSSALPFSVGGFTFADAGNYEVPEYVAQIVLGQWPEYFERI